ncbi:hypothetical protein [Microbispora sitophila]|nr:hypothetical protein [Microbispora sitophila]
MRIMILGGSWFAGRAVVAEAVQRGWQVTLFNRGAAGHHMERST